MHWRPELCQFARERSPNIMDAPGWEWFEPSLCALIRYCFVEQALRLSPAGKHRLFVGTRWKERSTFGVDRQKRSGSRPKRKRMLPLILRHRRRQRDSALTLVDPPDLELRDLLTALAGKEEEAQDRAERVRVLAQCGRVSRPSWDLTSSTNLVRGCLAIALSFQCT